jgi:hypothetical protein
MKTTCLPFLRQIAATALVAAALAAPASGQPVPTVMSYQGRLTDNTPAQNPLTQMLPMTFRIYDAPSPGGLLLWSESWAAVSVVDGIFSVLLGSNAVPIDPAVFAGGGERYLEIEVNGEILLPRQQLGSVGFAGQAENAADSDQLGGLSAAAWQQRVAGTCAAGSSIRSITATGAVTCEPDDQGITSEADPQVSSAIAGAVPRWNGATLVDGALRDTGTRIGINESSPDTRLQVTDGSISLEASSLANLGALWFKTQDSGVVSTHHMFLQGDPDPALEESLSLYHVNVTPTDAFSPSSAKAFRFQWDGNVYLQGGTTAYGYETPRVRRQIVGAAELRAEEGATTVRHFSGSYAYLTAGDQYMHAPLPEGIRDGARLQDFKCTVVDNSASAEMAINLFRVDRTGGFTQVTNTGWCYSGSATGCSFSASFASASPITLDSDVNPAYETVDRDNYSYLIDVWTSNPATCGANCSFHSCEITYEVDRVD